MSAFDHFSKKTSDSVLEEMLNWFGKQENVVLARANKEWYLTYKGNKMWNGDLIQLLIEAQFLFE